MPKENESMAFWCSVLTRFTAMRGRRGSESGKELSNTLSIKF